MRYWFLFVVFIVLQHYTVKKNFEQKPASQSHVLITGQWVESESLNRLKARDIAEPHPFNWVSSHQDLLTCFIEGKPFFWDFGFQHSGFLEKKEDTYHWMNKDSVKVRLRFSVSGKDTTLVYEYQYKENEPYFYALSKIPWATPCDFDYYPGKNLRSGRTKSYHHYYFKGKYQVKDMETNQISTVEISPNYRVSGFPEVETYRLDTYCEPLLLTMYRLDTIHSKPIFYEGKQYPRIFSRDEQRFTIQEHQDGFDLHHTNYFSSGQSKFRVLEKAYEFRRE